MDNIPIIMNAAKKVLDKEKDLVSSFIIYLSCKLIRELEKEKLPIKNKE